MKLKYNYLIILLLITLVACSPEVDSSPGTAIAQPTVTVLLPISSSSIATPEIVSISPIQTPETLNLSGGAVVGTILLTNGNRTEPYSGAILYLAETITDTDGNKSFVAMDRINSPHTIVDENGEFVFLNIPEGNYGLVLDTVRDSYFLHYPETNDPILIYVNTEEPVQIGELIFDNLPVVIE